MKYTMAAFLSQDNLGDDFYGPEYNRQLDAGEREKMSATQSVESVRYLLGKEQIQLLMAERDRFLYQEELRYQGRDNDAYRDTKKRVDEWYFTSKTSTEAAYYYDTGGGGQEGVTKRPTFKHLHTEMINIGTPGSPEWELGNELNPALTKMLVEVARLWNQNDKDSREFAHDSSWWHKSQAESEAQPSSMRGVFRDRVTTLARQAPDEETRRAFNWYAETIITPLMNGYDFDDPYIVDSEPLFAPER
jgi:hypothetical protein